MFIHNPHTGSSVGGRVTTAASGNDINLLNINQSVSCLNTGQLDPSCENDLLFVGTQTNLLAYDVNKNSDLFYKDVS